MKHTFKITFIIIFAVLLSVFGFSERAAAFSRGIYLTQDTVQDNRKLDYLIRQAKIFHIDTFVIDINRPSEQYSANIEKVKQNGIRYVARIVVFPLGGTHAQVTDRRIWAARLALANEAIRLGASAIQLDYIRYRAQGYSEAKVKYIFEVAQYFRKNLEKQVELQMDIFGVAAHGPVHTIGQDPRAFAHIIDAFCPMVYPSHYEPFLHHAVRPYETVFNSVTALKKRLQGFSNKKVYAFIELYNYRYPLSSEQKIKYIRAEIKAAQDSGADGWYAWSPRNLYEPLFQALRDEPN